MKLIQHYSVTAFLGYPKLSFIGTIGHTFAMESTASGTTWEETIPNDPKSALH
jgi:hypothetical protein